MAPPNAAIYKSIVAVVTFDDDRAVAAAVVATLGTMPAVMSMPAVSVVMMIVHPMPLNNDCFGAGHCRYSQPKNCGRGENVKQLVHKLSPSNYKLKRTARGIRSDGIRREI